MSRSDEERIGDILKAAELASKIADEGEQAFVSDWKNIPAAERALHIIEEAATKLSDETASRYPEAPWSQIRRFRTLITHEYHKVDPGTLCDTLDKSVPALVEMILNGPVDADPLSGLPDSVLDRVAGGSRQASSSGSGSSLGKEPCDELIP